MATAATILAVAWAEGAMETHGIHEALGQTSLPYETAANECAVGRLVISQEKLSRYDTARIRVRTWVQAAWMGEATWVPSNL